MILNNLHNIIATKDIYFIYIEEKVSKKLINDKVVRCSKFGSNYFLIKLLCNNDLIVSNRVVSNFATLFFYYTIYYTIIIIFNIYLLLTTYYTILLCFNELAVGSNMIF